MHEVENRSWIARILGRESPFLGEQQCRLKQGTGGEEVQGTLAEGVVAA